MSSGTSSGGGRCRRVLSTRPGSALITVLLLLPAIGFTGSGCGKKKVDPNQPTAAEQAITVYQQGALLLEGGRYEEAIASFNKALEIDEGNILCHYSLALAYLRTGRLDEAMAEADRALELKPNYTEVHNIKGMIYNEQGLYLKAMESFRQLLDTPSYGKPWIAYYNLGFAASSAGNKDEALFYYTRALELKNDYVQARHQRGLMLERLGREPEAIKEYETVLAALPDSPEIHFSLARLYFRAGRAVDARLNFEWVMRYSPGTDYSSQSARYLNMMEESGH